jgi:hypothetical protein
VQQYTRHEHLGGEKMSILLNPSSPTKKFNKKEAIKIKLEQIVTIAVITIYATVTVLALTAINPEVVNGMLG